MRYEIRPLGAWDRPVTEPRAGSGRFRAPWSTTLDLLAHEIELLDGTLAVLQIDVEQGDIRRDGMLATRAKVGFPGVKVSFDSRHGSLTYASDAYEPRYHSDPPAWQANVRAIALALQALRAVDRYGVTRSGEQYRGWTAITAATQRPMTRSEAATFIVGSGHTSYTAAQVLSSPLLAANAYRQAAKACHPDRGGDSEVFHRLTAARDVLVGAVA
jgi:hypothetical protein